ADAKAVEDAVAACRSAMAEGGVDKITSATDALMRASHRVAEVLYRSGGAASAAAQGGDAAQEKPGGSDVIDAEFVDVDDKQKPN
ncbi:MAG: molecular chaperone DnaK, partial [Candidatus Acidiferrales bacterium]